MSTGAERDEELAVETIAAAVEAGVSVFDTPVPTGTTSWSSVTTSGC